jgi:hypothetical protein
MEAAFELIKTTSWKKHLLKLKVFYDALLTVSGSHSKLSIISRHIHKNNNDTKKKNELPGSMEGVLHYS